MRTFFLLLLSVGVLLLNSCEQCYNERFCRDMMGQRPGTVVALMGTPTSCSTLNGVTEYIWHEDRSYDEWVTTAGHETKWKDKKGRKHTEWVPAQSYLEHHDRFAVMRIRFINNRAVSYDCDSAGDMCNYFVPQQYIERYRAEDAAKRQSR